MTDHNLPAIVLSEWLVEEQRHLTAVARFIARWPSFTLHVAYALLGSAVACVEGLGGDVEGFLRELRKGPKAAEESAS